MGGTYNNTYCQVFRIANGKVQEVTEYLDTELVTVPAKILTLWAEYNFPLPAEGFERKRVGRPIPFEELSLEQPWESFDISHELTSKGIDKFVADYRKTVDSV